MNIERLYKILSYRRPHESVGEAVFYNDVLLPLEPEVFVDDKGKRLAYTLCTDPASRILWSCHIDTMHTLDTAGSAKVLQEIEHDAELDIIYSTGEECLGADDGAGVWLLLEMYEAGVPGTYIFHRGEERGGIGSEGMEKHHKKFLQRFTHAIAFDRKADCSVITHQMPGRCCSEDFAKAFASLVMGDPHSETPGYALAPDDGGTFTDTANYIEHIPECANVSIGYEGEHRKGEMLDVAYLTWLRDRMVAVGASTHELPVVRKVTDKDNDRWDYRGYNYYQVGSVKTGGGRSGLITEWDDEDDGLALGGKKKKKHIMDEARESWELSAEELLTIGDDEILDWLDSAYPSEIISTLRKLADDAWCGQRLQEDEDARIDALEEAEWQEECKARRALLSEQQGVDDVEVEPLPDTVLAAALKVAGVVH